MKIVMPGGSGQVGTILARYLTKRNHEVVVLSRSPVDEPWKVVQWDGASQGDWVSEIDGSDVIINLAGKNVNCRYNDKNRELIMSSRIDSTRAVGQAIQEVEHPPKLWLQASTATIYAHSFEDPNDEYEGIIGGNEPDAPRKWDFSVNVARNWEQAAEEMVPSRVRLVKLRTSLVMDPYPDGIFDTLVNLTRFGLGGRAASGKQMVSWIHHLDFCRVIETIIDNDALEGPVNVTAPNPLQQAEFMKKLRSAYGRWLGLPATKWMLSIGAWLMRTETELLLKSRYVLPKKLEEQGFEFSYPEWDDAVADLIDDWKVYR